MADNPFDRFNARDPFNRFNQADPFNRFNARSPFGGGGRRRSIDPEMQLRQMTGLLEDYEDENKSNYALRTLKNAPHDVTDFLRGAAGLMSLGMRAVKDVGIRIPFNFITRDEEDLDEIINHYKKAPSAVGDVIYDEAKRLGEVYGSALAFTGTLGQAGSLGPLKDAFEEDPLFTLLDVAAVGGVAGAVPKMAARRMVGRATELAGGRKAGVDSVRRALPGGELRAYEGVTPSTRGTRAFEDNRQPYHNEPASYLTRMALPDKSRVMVERKGQAGQQINQTGKWNPKTQKWEANTPLDDLQAGDLRKAAMKEVAYDPEIQKLPLKERWEEVKRLEQAMGEAKELLDRGTVVAKWGKKIEDSTNIFRLGYMTLGKFPGMERRLEILKNKSNALGVTAQNSRLVDALKHRYRRNIAPALKAWNKLDDVQQAKVIHAMQSATADPALLSAEERAAYEGMKAVGVSQRSKVIRAMTAKGTLTAYEANKILDNRIKSNALTGEARAKIAEGGLSNIEEQLYTRLSSLRNSDRLIKRAEGIRASYNELIKKSKANDDLFGPSKLTPAEIAKLDKASMQVQLLDLLDERMARRELGFLPGQRDFVQLEKLSVMDMPEFLTSNVADVDKLTIRSVKKKTDIVMNPLAVEEQMLRYVDFVAHLQGQIKLVDDVKAVSTRIDKKDLKHMLYENAAAEIQGRNTGFVLLDIPGEDLPMLVPRGAEEIYKAAFQPEVRGAGRAFVDFTKSEYAKVVLLMNPGWLAFNIIGNTELYALAGGKASALAKAIGMKVGDSVFQKYFANKATNKYGRLGHMLKDMSEEWRKMVPESQVMGFTHSETRKFSSIEYYTRGQKNWRDTSLAKLGEWYADKTDWLTKKGHLRELNEGIEEVYRGALWLSQSQRKLAAENFFETGKLLIGNDANRAGMIKMAKEFDPALLEVPGPTRLSPGSALVRDNVNKFLNDYYRLGPVERSMMRRLLPFYSWTKFVNRLAVELPVNNPIRMGIAAFTTNAVNDARAMDENLPEWLQEATLVKEHEDGTATFQSGTAEIFQGVLFGSEGFKRAPLGLNPLLKVPIEFFTGMNIMRGTKNRVAPTRAGGGLTQDFSGRGAYKMFPHGLEETTPRPGPGLALLRSGLVPIPFVRQLEKKIRGGPHDDVGSVWELAMEIGNIVSGQPRAYPGAFLDKDTGKPYEMGGTVELFGSGFGWGEYTLDADAVREREIEKKLSAAKRIIAEREEQRLRGIR